jgi:hypothetical protein
MTLQEWLSDSERDYVAGLDLYNEHKRDRKHDAFLNVNNPDKIRIELLFRKLLKILKIKEANGEYDEAGALHSAPIKKVQPITFNEPEPPVQTPETLKYNKPYINRLLTLNFTDLQFSDKMIFNNDEGYFLKKKGLMIRNGNIEQEMRSLHTKVKSIDADIKFNEDRKKLMQKLAALDDEKADNWEVIDNWEETQEEKVKADLNDVQKSIERVNLIKANENFIYRAERDLPGMPETTEEEKKKKLSKMAEVARRKEELREMGVPYSRKPRAK